MLDRIIDKALERAAPIIAAAVVDKLVDRLPQILDVVSDHMAADLPYLARVNQAVQSTVAGIPSTGEQVAREIIKNLPFGLGRR